MLTLLETILVGPYKFKNSICIKWEKSDLWY